MYVGKMQTFLALPALLGKAAWAGSKSRTGKKMATAAKPFGFYFTLKLHVQFVFFLFFTAVLTASNAK